MDVTSIRTRVVVTVTAEIKDGPQVSAPYRTGGIVADLIVITYRYDHDGGVWTAMDVTATGFKVLKPAPDGTRRLGKERPSAYFGMGVPDELAALVDDLRPSGAVTVPVVG